MLICFEGINRAGKSTISKELGHQIGVPVFRAFKHPDMDLLKVECEKEGFRPNDFFEDLVVMDYVRQTKSSVILDRAVPSYWAYSILIGRKTNWTIIHWWLDRFKEMNGVYIWLHAPFTILKKRINHSSLSESQYENLKDCYEKLYNYLRCDGVNVIKCEVFNETPEQITKELITNLHRFGLK
jgi:thymidylate kinase